MDPTSLSKRISVNWPLVNGSLSNALRVLAEDFDETRSDSSVGSSGDLVPAIFAAPEAGESRLEVVVDFSCSRLKEPPTYVIIESNARMCEVYTQAVGEATLSYVGTVRQSQGGDVLPGCHSIEIGLDGVIDEHTDKLVLRMVSLRDKKRFVMHSFKLLLPPDSPQLKAQLQDVWTPAAAAATANASPVGNGVHAYRHDGGASTTGDEAVFAQPAAILRQQPTSAGQSQMKQVRGMLQDLTKPGSAAAPQLTLGARGGSGPTEDQPDQLRNLMGAIAKASMLQKDKERKAALAVREAEREAELKLQREQEEAARQLAAEQERQRAAAEEEDRRRLAAEVAAQEEERKRLAAEAAAAAAAAEEKAQQEEMERQRRFAAAKAKALADDRAAAELQAAGMIGLPQPPSPVGGKLGRTSFSSPRQPEASPRSHQTSPGLSDNGSPQVLQRVEERMEALEGVCTRLEARLERTLALLDRAEERLAGLAERRLADFEEQLQARVQRAVDQHLAAFDEQLEMRLRSSSARQLVAFS